MIANVRYKNGERDSIEHEFFDIKDGFMFFDTKDEDTVAVINMDEVMSVNFVPENFPKNKKGIIVDEDLQISASILREVYRTDECFREAVFDSAYSAYQEVWNEHPKVMVTAIADRIFDYETGSDN